MSPRRNRRDDRRLAESEVREIEKVDLPPRRIKMMWDHGAFPLWSVDRFAASGSPLRDRLPISETLRQDLQAWSDEWTATVWRAGGPAVPGWQPPSFAVVDDWDARGRALLGRLRAELGLGFVVGYRNPKTRQDEWPD